MSFSYLFPETIFLPTLPKFANQDPACKTVAISDCSIRKFDFLLAYGCVAAVSIFIWLENFK